MAVNKNFVVKNGLEVNNNLLVADVSTNFVGIGTSVSSYQLHVMGGIGGTEAHVTGLTTVGGNLSAESALTVAGNTNITGITTLAGGGGITTTGGDLYIGGDLYVLDDISYDEVTGRNLNITGVGTFGSVDVNGGDTSISALNVSGVGTFSNKLNVTGIASFTDVVVSAATTFNGPTTFNYGSITFANVDATKVTVGVLSATDAVVSGAATVNGDLSVLGDLNVTGDISYDEQTARNLNVTGIATIATLVGYSSEFSGAVGFQSGGTLIGAAITTLNITGGGATAHTSTDGTVQTVTFPAAGASIGLAIALGG